ncbi:MAG: hypothetical protein SO401_04060 [Blautia sp.]|nr:hypothetical protein [Blautia sp.]
MEKLIGLILFFIGLGMVIGLLVAENVILVITAAIFLLIGYHLFCR